MTKVLNIQELQQDAQALSEEAEFRYRLLVELGKPNLDINTIRYIAIRYNRNEPISKDIPLDILIKFSTTVFNITVEELRSRRSKSDYVKARLFIAMILRQQNWTFQAIADEFNKSTATILKGLDSLSDLIENRDPVYYPLWLTFSNLIIRYKFEAIIEE